MWWNEQLFIYCERGSNPAFWAEPLNAISNGAFIIAGLAAASEALRPPAVGSSRSKSDGIAEWALIGLVLIIGVGSFLFHTTARRWAQFADWVPIAIFMLAYFGYVLRRFLGVSWLMMAAGVVFFYVCLQLAAQIKCPPGLLPITEASGARCLNGSLAYSPAFVALVVMSGMLAAMGKRTWRYLAAAGVVFGTALTLRTLDIEVCALTEVAGRRLGVHFLWHMLNAITVYILLIAAIRRARQPAEAVPVH